MARATQRRGCNLRNWALTELHEVADGGLTWKSSAVVFIKAEKELPEPKLTA